MYRYYGFGISVLLVEVDTPVRKPEPTIKPNMIVSIKPNMIVSIKPNMIDTKRFMARYSKQNDCSC